MSLALALLQGVHGRLAMNARSIIDGLDAFLDRHTGTVDSPDDLYILNPQGVISNNLHYETGTQWYSPTQAATTEGQSLLILGYYHAWKATGEQRFLDKATHYMDAYLDYFYQGQPVPDEPQLYNANWVVNGKDPFQTFGPADPDNPSEPGIKGYPLAFVGGVADIPASMPTRGDLLVRVYMVYTGELSYQSVRSTVRRGSTKYAGATYTRYDGKTYRIDDQEEIPNTHGDPPGRVRLADAFTGTRLVNFGTLTGPECGRNIPYNPWPMWRVPPLEELGNASDAEQWFCEAAFLMYEATGSERYRKAFEASLFTNYLYTTIEDQSLYFKHDLDASDPFNIGIAYWWDYLAPEATVIRNGAGYIEGHKGLTADGKEATLAMEQIAIWNQVGAGTVLRHILGLTASAGRIEFLAEITSDLNTDGVVYRVSYPYSQFSSVPAQFDVPVASMVATQAADGTDLVLLDGSSFVPYGSASFQTIYSAGVMNSPGRSDYIGRTTISGDDGVIFGFWLTESEHRPLSSITYRSVSGSALLRVEDALGNKYARTLPASAVWTTLALSWADFAPVGAAPAVPTPTADLEQVEIVSAAGTCVYEWYAYGEVPGVLVPDGQWMKSWYIHAISNPAMTIALGDVAILNKANERLAYTPGVVPFSNNYSVAKNSFGFWRSTPYVGYQYPVIWALGGMDELIENNVAFLFDAQEAHAARIGIMGPVLPVYIWPRFDNAGDGAIGQFDFGGDQPYPWGGYNARAFYSGCRLWSTLVRQGKAVDTRLVQFCERYCQYLAEFQDAHSDLTPTAFPRDAVPFNDGYDPEAEDGMGHPDHTGHMTGLYMAGAVEMLEAGSTSPYPSRVVQGAMRELARTYVIESGEDEHMTGSFSSWVGGNYFYGFWAGEIMRALGLYIAWEARNKPRYDLGVPNSPIRLDDGSVLTLGAGSRLLLDQPILRKP